MRFNNFDFFSPVRIKFGVDSLDTIGQECSQLGNKKAMLVVDRNLVDTDSFNKIIESLDKARIKPAVFSDFNPEPDEECMERGLAELRKHGCEVLIGFGGGSAIDTAKGVAILATNPSPIKQYAGSDKVTHPALPIITIPTTAGTGSEVGLASAIINNAEKRKYTVKTPFIYAKVAILDPSVLATLPQAVASSAGMDAITHGVESYISRFSSPMSDMFAITSLNLALKSIRDFVANRANLEVAANMLLASTLAAIAMSHARLGVVHALAQIIGPRFHTSHGFTNAVLLPYCLEAMASDAIEKFAVMARIMASEANYATDAEYATHVPEMFSNLLDDLEIETGLNKLGVTEGDLKVVADDALRAGVAASSPKDFSAEDMVQILRHAL